MIATTIPQTLPTRTWNSLLGLAALVAVAVVLIAGSFAIGRSTADDATTTIVKDRSASVAPADVPPAADDASCGRTAHTPPC